MPDFIEIRSSNKDAPPGLDEIARGGARADVDAAHLIPLVRAGVGFIDGTQAARRSAA